MLSFYEMVFNKTKTTQNKLINFSQNFTFNLKKYSLQKV